jgi:hypothetical protein
LSGFVEGISPDVIHASKSGYSNHELTDFEWAAIRSFLSERADDHRFRYYCPSSAGAETEVVDYVSACALRASPDKSPAPANRATAP